MGEDTTAFWSHSLSQISKVILDIKINIKIAHTYEETISEEA